MTTFVTKLSNAKNIGNFTTLLKPDNIGTHSKGIETSFWVLPLLAHHEHVARRPLAEHVSQPLDGFH
jgi:hypothetical protein